MIKSGLYLSIALPILFSAVLQTKLLAQTTPISLKVEPPDQHSLIQTRLPPAAITLGGRASVDEADGFLDILAPVIGSDTGFLFLNPKTSLGEAGENEQNVGLGIRKMVLGEHAIVGANAFYDSRESAYSHRVHQLGLGIELLSEWIDLRANYYMPENDMKVIGTLETQETQITEETTYGDLFFTEHEVRQIGTTTTTTTVTTHHFDKFEDAMEGIDFEIGIKVPVIERVAETRVFGGYYYYSSSFREDLQGFKARIEVRALPGLILDAEWYEDRDLHGSDYYFGARVRLPFEIGNLFRGKNPFEGAREYFRRVPQPLKARMTDMVMRDLDIVMEESDFIEDLDKLKVDETVEEEEFNVTLLGDITFVDGDNTSGTEDGTFENPYNTVQEGVNNAFGDSYVHVQDAATTYNENVVLTDNVKLWGSGYQMFGIESGTRPVVDGRSLGPTITMANGTEIWGMNIINTDTGGPSINRTIAGETLDTRRVGIYAENKTNLTISNGNLIEKNERGVLLATDQVTDFLTTIKDNTIQNNVKEGLKILGQGSSMGTFTTLLSGNTISSNGASIGTAFDGANIKATNYTNINAEIIGNTFNNNGLAQTFDGTVALGRRGLGIDLSSGSGDFVATIDGNTFTNNGKAESYSSGGAQGTFGLSIDLSSSSGGFTATVANNTFKSNGQAQTFANGLFVAGAGGIVVFGSRTGDITLTLSNNITQENGLNQSFAGGNAFGSFGLNISLSSGSGNRNITLSNNEIFNNGLTQTFAGGTTQAKPGFNFLVNTTSSAINVTLSNNSINSNGIAQALGGGTPSSRDGADIDLSSSSGNVSINLTGNTAKANGQDGLDVSMTGSTVTLFAERNVTSQNASDGIKINASSATGSYTIDFGGGGAGSAGFNSFFDNSGFQMNNVSAAAFTIKAENNFWNSNPANNPPNDNGEFEQGAGTIDADPFLTTNPNP